MRILWPPRRRHLISLSSSSAGAFKGRWITEEPHYGGRSLESRSPRDYGSQPAWFPNRVRKSARLAPKKTTEVTPGWASEMSKICDSFAARLRKSASLGCLFCFRSSGFAVCDVVAIWPLLMGRRRVVASEGFTSVRFSSVVGPPSTSWWRPPGPPAVGRMAPRNPAAATAFATSDCFKTTPT